MANLILFCRKRIRTATLAAAAVCLFALPGSLPATTLTVAAHEDTDAAAFTFAGSVLNGGYALPGLSLNVLGTTYTNVGFEFSGPLSGWYQMTLGGVSQYALDGGYVRYFHLANPTVDLFKVSFSGATLTLPGGFGGSQADLQGVSFSGTAVAGNTFSNEAFSYSFVPVGPDSFKVNFTSSAVVQPVPEPFTMGLVAAALGAGLARRRRSLSR